MRPGADRSALRSLRSPGRTGRLPRHGKGPIAARRRRPVRPTAGGNRFAHTVPTQGFLPDPLKCTKCLILLGERGGTRTLDPMIKSHVLYRLSYALTCRAV